MVHGLGAHHVPWVSAATGLPEGEKRGVQCEQVRGQMSTAGREEEEEEEEEEEG